MLFEAIFLVLGAVILTVLGVGMAKEKSTLQTIKERAVEVPYVGEKTAGVTLPDGSIMVDENLPDLKKIVAYLHEGFHSLAQYHPRHRARFSKYAGREDYADLAALYHAVERRNEALEEESPAKAKFWQDVAYTAIDWYRTSGRAEKFGTERRLKDAEKYLDQTKIEVDSDKGERLEEAYKLVQEVPLPHTLSTGITRTSKLFDEEKAAESMRLYLSGETSGIGQSHEMQLPLRDKEGNFIGKDWLGAAWGYIDKLYGASKGLEKSLKGSFSKDGYKSPHDVIGDAAGLYQELVGSKIDKLVGRKGSGKAGHG